MNRTALTLLLLSACTGDDTTGPDAAGTAHVACAEFSGGVTYDKSTLNATCSFNLAGYTPHMLSGRPAVLVAGTSEFTLEYIGPDTYRGSVGFTWTMDPGERGVAVILAPTDEGRCVWLRCEE